MAKLPARVPDILRHALDPPDAVHLVNLLANHRDVPELPARRHLGLERSAEGGLTILWVAVRYSLYAETAIAAYQAVNDPARPLAALSGSEQDEALVRIAQQIRDTIARHDAERQRRSDAERP